MRRTGVAAWRVRRKDRCSRRIAVDGRIVERAASGGGVNILSRAPCPSPAQAAGSPAPARVTQTHPVISERSSTDLRFLPVSEDISLSWAMGRFAFYVGVANRPRGSQDSAAKAGRSLGARRVCTPRTRIVRGDQLMSGISDGEAVADHGAPNLHLGIGSR